MTVIDLNEVREARQEAIDWGNKVGKYFSEKTISDAENELLDDVASSDWATSQLAVAALEMIADGEMVASYDNGKLILSRTEKLIEQLNSKGEVTPYDTK